MRTASLGQSTPTSSPKITITLGADVYTSEGAGGSERVLSVKTDEQAYGGSYQVVLDNSDEVLNAKSYEGSVIDINLAFIGQTADSFPPLYVLKQKFLSQDGKLQLVLDCVDKWYFIQAQKANLTGSSYNQEWQTEDADPPLSERLLPDGETTLGDVTDIYDVLLANGDKTIWDIIQDIATFTGVTVTLDDEDAYVDTLKPPISIDDCRSGLNQLLDMTKCFLKYKTNGNFGVYDETQHSSVFTFNHMNTYYMSLVEEGVTVPNRVYFWSFNETGDDWISGVASDEDSHTALGRYIDTHILFGSLDNHNMNSEANLNAFAAGAIEKFKAQVNQGYLIAPMHVALELFDKITVVDDRYTSPKTTTGYVHRIVREYDRGVYQITVYLGGTTSGYTPPGGTDSKGIAQLEEPKAPPFTMPSTTDAALLPIKLDMTFTVAGAVASWSAGTIYFADGETQAVSAGNSGTIADTDKHFLYCDLEDASPQTLKMTTNFAAAATGKHILLAIIIKDATQDKLNVIPAEGAGATGLQFLVAASNVIAANLAAIVADLGLVLAGEFRLGNGNNPGVGEHFSGIRMYKSGTTYRIEGIDDDVIQTYMDSDGRFYAGGGNVQLDSDGLSIYGDADLLLYNSSLVQVGWIGSYDNVMMFNLGNEDGMIQFSCSHTGGTVQFYPNIDSIDLKDSCRILNVPYPPTDPDEAISKRYADSLIPAGGVTGSGTSGKMVKWTDTDEIGDATNTDTDVADAVYLKHEKGYDTTLGSMIGDIVPLNTNTLDLGSSTKYWEYEYLKYLVINDSGSIKPKTNNSPAIGDSTHRFSDVYAVLGNFSGALTLNTLASDLIPTLTSLEIGDATTWWAKVFIGQDYNYIGGSLGDMDFYVKGATDASVLAMSITDGASPTLSLNSHKITDVLDPTSDQDAATKKYVDDKVATVSQNNRSGYDLETIYQNTSGKVMFVAVTGVLELYDPGDTRLSGAVYITAYCGSSTPPTPIVGRAGFTANLEGLSSSYEEDFLLYGSVFFVVPPNYYYYIHAYGGGADDLAPTVYSWYEWELG